MAKDSSLPLRKAVVSHLRADAALIALVPSARVFGRHVSPNPQKPFTRYGTPSVLPDRASCQDGSRIFFALHGFAYGPSEDDVSDIGNALARAIDGPDGKGVVLILSDGSKAHLTWAGSQILPDPEEAGLWHAVVNCEAVAVG